METVLTELPPSGFLDNWTRVPTPGNKASIGATATQFRLKQSAPYMASRFETGTTGLSSHSLGSNSANGGQVSDLTGWRSNDARVIQPKSSRLRNYGVKVTSIRPSQDRSFLPISKQIDKYDWQLKVDAATSNYGSLFEDLPHGYAPPPGSLLRGGNYPGVTNILGDRPPQSNVEELVFAKRFAENLPPINFTPGLMVQGGPPPEIAFF